MTEQVQKLMSALNITEEEALQVIEDDKAIDRGAKLFEQSTEQQKASKHYRQADRKKPVILETKPRERKADDDKRMLIEILGDCLHFHDCENVVATNPERQLDFEYHGRKLRLVLSAPRS